MDYAITTVDNPYDPFDDFEQWFLFDEEMGYHTCAWLGRLAHVTDLMSDEEYDESVKSAMDKIVLNDPTNLYILVRKESESQG